MSKHLFLLAVLLIPISIFAQFGKLRTPATNQQTVKPVIVNNNSAVVKNTLANTHSYDFSKVKICVDITEPANVNLPPRRNSAGAPIPKINSDGTIQQVAVTQQPLAGATDKMWNPGEVITVFLSTTNGSEWLWNRIKFYAKKWEEYANIKFEFINSRKDAKIKVGIFSTGQSWSWMGRDVLFNPFGKYTMNFGWLMNANLTELELASVVLHEFGHALGFHHEHQSPAATVQWNLDKTYKYFAEKSNWSPAQVDFNVINKFSRNNTNYSAYDKYSIMHYPIPADLLINGVDIPENYTISQVDAQYARMWYPFAPKGINTVGNLRTNDDCDDIFFKVEYDVVAPNQVEFKLSLGEKNNQKVTWWKQIGIPRTNNTETLLWVQNHSLIKEENRVSASLFIPANEINVNKGISFWKAKFLGVHTLLNYKWNVLPAIKGGCRITLMWNKDNCS